MKLSNLDQAFVEAQKIPEEHYGPTDKRQVRSVWIVHTGQTASRFVTAYPLERENE